MRQHGQKKKFFLTDYPKSLHCSPSDFDTHDVPFLIVLNPNLTIRWVNAECIRIAQLSLPMLEGKHINALKCPILNNFSIISHVSILKSEDTCSFQESVMVDGATITYLYTLALISLSAKDHVIILSGHEITKIKQIEQENFGHQQKIRQLTENIPGAVFRRSLPTNRIEFFNSMFQVFSGHLALNKSDEFLNSVDACIYAEDRENYMNTLQLSLITDTEYEVEYRIQTREGQLINLLERGRPVKNLSGEQISIDGFITDITDRKKIENALMESEERFLIIADFAPVGITITDTMGTCRFVNQEWCRQTGLTPSEATDRNWITGIFDDERDKMGSKVKKINYSNGQKGHQYSFLSRRGEEVWVHTTTAELKNHREEVIGYIFCNTDITLQKREEEMSRRNEKRL